MSLWVKVLAAEHGTLSSFPGSHMMEGERAGSKSCPLTSIPCVSTRARARAHVHTESKIKWKKFLAS